MFAILKKEIQSFFATPIGYLVIGLFLLANGLFLWVFKGEFNILDYGFADLSGFYFLAPWVFIFLVPAITMKSFSEEQKQGTLELLLTKPISLWQLVLGKYLGVLVLVIFALLPTVLYIYTVQQLGNPVGNIDLGATLGAYVGIFLVAAVYASVGVFTSSISNNQIVAFLLAVILCFVLYYGFEGVAELIDAPLQNFGIKYHFNTISNGVVDSRNIIYFVSVAVLFLFFTKLTLTQK